MGIRVFLEERSLLAAKVAWSATGWTRVHLLGKRWMRAGVIALVLVGLSSVALAQGRRFGGGAPNNPAEVEETGTSSVQGSIRDAVSGTALSKAEVHLIPRGGGRPGMPGPGRRGITTRSDKNGEFQFQGLPAGAYNLTVLRLGYSSCGAIVEGLGARMHNCSAPLRVDEGQNLRGVRLRLQPAAVVTGQVTDEDGDPLAGATVEAEQYRYIRGSKMLMAASRAVTDDRGMYRIYNVPPGRYFIKVQIRGGMVGPMQARPAGPGGFALPGGKDEETAYAATYYPTGRDPAEAVPLQLTPGAEMGGIDFQLSPTKTYMVSGQLLGIPSDVQGGGSVIARSRDPISAFGGPSAMATLSMTTGNFVLRGLLPGSYDIVARWGGARRGQTSASLSATMDVDVTSSSVDGVSLTLAPDVLVEGMVTLPEGAADTSLAGMRVTADRGFAGGQMAARVEDSGRFQTNNFASENPLYGVENLPAGFYVKSMKMGGQNLMDAGPANNRAASGRFEIELANDGATVSGVARDRDGAALPAARIALLSETTGQARRIWSRSTTAGEDGTFTLEALAPGKYRAYVFEDLAEGPALDADFLAQFTQRGKSIELKPKGSFNLELVAIPTSETDLLLGDVAH